jgi:hypothetical protein
MNQQRCAEVDADMWFEPTNTVAAKAAIRICHTCLVEPECRAWALADATLEGIAGGLTEQQRTQLRRDDLPDRCKRGHVRTDQNTRHIKRSGTDRTWRRCLTCDANAPQRKGRAA